MEVRTDKRIVLNVAATYGRSLIALVCGLVSTRWLLGSLGEVDYGLWGVIGGLAAFVTFFNALMAQSVGRFLAVAVGRQSSVREWFWTAVTLHFVLATFLTTAGWPVGAWTVRNVLTIPPDRVEAAVAVWKAVCVWIWFGMAIVPWSAMFVARQEIAEMTAYSLLTTVANTIFIFWMARHPGDWLVRYAHWTVGVLVVPQLLMVASATFRWRDCRWGGFPRNGFGSRLCELAGFAGWRGFGMLSGILGSQGVAIAVNRALGSAKNAALSIGNTVASQSMSLAAAMCGALAPVISSAFGSGDLSRMRELALHACRWGTLFALLFSIPLALEVETVLRLWLVKPPEGSAYLCVCILTAGVLDKLCEGHWMAIFAVGKIRGYQCCCVLCGMTALLVACAGLRWTVYGLEWVGVALVIDKAMAVMVRLWFGRKVAGLGVGEWMKCVALPVAAIGGLSLSAGWTGKLFLAANNVDEIVRVAVVASFCAAITGIAWFMTKGVFSKSEEAVDFVYCWCNGQDPEFLALKAKWGGKDGVFRFADHGELRASIASVKKYAPWVRTIWVVVNDVSAIPEWLAKEGKVKIVRHREIMPEKYLPTFNAVSIEFWLWRIPGLSERFVYANDDMFLARKVSPRHFFTRQDKMICRYYDDDLRAQAAAGKGSYDQMLLNARALVSGTKAENRPPHHNMDGYLKSVMAEACQHFEREIDQTSGARFREKWQIQRDIFSLYALKTGRGVFRKEPQSWWRSLLGMTRWESVLVRVNEFRRFERLPRWVRPYFVCFNDSELARESDRTEFARWLNRAGTGV